MIVKSLAQIAREEWAESRGDREAAIRRMRLRLLGRRDIIDQIATNCIDTIIELQMEKAHGPIQGSA